MTWERLVALEPRLARLEAECQIDSRRRLRWDGQLRIWYGQIKPHLTTLVGWHRRDPGPDELFGQRAYDVAYQHLLSTLTTRRKRVA